MGSSGAGGDYEIDQSVRLDNGPYLSSSFNGNEDKFTVSVWLKRWKLGSDSMIMSAAGSNHPGGADIHQFGIDSSDRLFAYAFENSSSQKYSVKTNRRLRDVSNWYHVVYIYDSGNSTSSDRIKLYINGELQTDLAANSYPSQNLNNYINNGEPWIIGEESRRLRYPLAAYLAEFNFIDGQAYDASYFGELHTVSNQWVPKEYAGSYSGTSFYLKFADGSNFGTDSSGEGNNWSTSSLASSDKLLDSPTNNFPTWNPLSTNHLPTLSEGNLKNLGDNNKSCNSTFGVTSGKWYWEMHVLTDSSSSNYVAATGVTSYQMENEGDTSPTLASAGRSYYRGMTSGGIYAYKNYTSTSHTEISSGGTFYGGAVISFRLDMDAGTLKYYTNNTLVHTDSTIPTDGTVIFPMQNATNSGVSRHNASIINFGQDSTFAGNKTAQGNTDGSGIGDFYYAVPSGFKAMCSANLANPSIAFPNQHFDTLLYTGNGSSQTISGLNFQPDWVWIKRREGENQFLTDSIRGAGVHLRSDQAIAESDNSDGFTSFTSDGFTLTGSGAAEPQINANGGTFVAWNWNGGGSTVTNNAGTISSQVRANTTAGFSILTYTGNGSSGATIGHGLGVAPDLVIIKRRDGSNSWQVFHQSLGAGKFMDISSSSVAETNSNRWNDTAPTSSVITLGNNSNVNSNNGTCVGYVFSEVAGYSKFGSYTGNGNASGTFVFTSFKPALVLTKIIDTMSENWTMSDNKRSPINPVDSFSRPDETSADTTGAAKMDFLSNGFKLRNTDDKTNKSGANYIYMAFAESPFKYSRAR